MVDLRIQKFADSWKSPRGSPVEGPIPLRVPSQVNGIPNFVKNEEPMREACQGASMAPGPFPQRKMDEEIICMQNYWV